MRAIASNTRTVSVCRASPFERKLAHQKRTLTVTGKSKGSKIPLDGPDPYHYTSGRWLHRDKLQREARSLQFDFPALCDKVLGLCPGSRNIVRYDKKEGGFNRVFIFTMDNGARLIARLPFRVTGPERLTTNSEVATIAYVQESTSIPLPEVVEWNDNKLNPIGSEYIIMKHAPGVQLHGLWPKMAAAKHLLAVKSLCKVMQSMAKLSFPAYGSLYFANAPIDPQLKIPFGDFCIGPNCTQEYWDLTPGDTRYYGQRKPNRGPWSDISEYVTALLDLGISRIPSPEAAPKNELPYRGSVEEHLRLAKINQTVIPQLIQNPLFQDLVTPMLLHADLNKRNIFVSEDDPTVITSIIDWQSTSIEPVFMYANETPDLIPILPPPESESIGAEESSTEDTPTEDEYPEAPEEKEARQKLEQDIWLCRQSFELHMQWKIPNLYAARVADSTLLRPLQYCGTSWRDSATAVRQELIELSQRWAELGLPGECPYQPTIQELEDHKPLLEQFENVQTLKNLLINNLETDPEGWVHPDDWDVKKAMLRDAYEGSLVDAEESEEAEITPDFMTKIWPFDIVKQEKHDK